MISVPIPMNTDFKLTVKYFPMSLAERPKKFHLSVGEFVTITEIRQKINDHLSTESTKQLPFMTRVQNKSILGIMSKERFKKSTLDKGEEIVAYERPFQNDSNEGNVLIEIKILQMKRSYLFMTNIQPISYSRIFVIDKRMTVRQFKKKIYEFFRPIIKRPQISFNEKNAGKNEDQIIEQEYQYFFETTTIGNN